MDSYYFYLMESVLPNKNMKKKKLRDELCFTSVNQFNQKKCQRIRTEFPGCYFCLLYSFLYPIKLI